MEREKNYLIASYLVYWAIRCNTAIAERYQIISRQYFQRYGNPASWNIAIKNRYADKILSVKL